MGDVIMNETIVNRFQSIYINTKAESWQDRIVLLKETFTTPTTNQLILKSLRLEDYPALLVSGTLNQIRFLRKKLSDLDNQEEIGNKSIQEIILKLMQLISQIGLKVVYIQNLEGFKNEML
jgi:hypothetical protein